jgi:hypothetical protein
MRTLLFRVLEIILGLALGAALIASLWMALQGLR